MFFFFVFFLAFFFAFLESGDFPGKGFFLNRILEMHFFPGAFSKSFFSHFWSIFSLSRNPSPKQPSPFTSIAGEARCSKYTPGTGTALFDALSPDAVVQRQPLGMWLTTGAQLTEVGSQKIQSRADVPRVVSSAKPQWVRMSDPMRNEIHLRNESRAALRWLSSCFSHDQLRLIRQAPQLHCMAAADAMAGGSTVGVGGWISTSQSFAWFSEQWDMTEVRKHWPQLTKNAQAYIACFETVAQLALAMTAVARMRTKHFRFTLPAASDNTSAESGINRLFTTTEPLSTFLQTVAAWSAHANVRLALTHLAGEKNVWAYELSRNRAARF